MDKIISSNRRLYDNFNKTAANIIFYYKNDERNKLLTNLRKEVEQLCEVEERMKIAEKISAELTASYDPEAEINDSQQSHVEIYKNRIANINPDVSKYSYLKEFDRTVEALLKAGSEGNDKESANTTDNDLQLTQNTISVIDPVSKKRMTDPVRNTICSHIYDRESVQALIKANGLARCPVPGCKYKEVLMMENMQTDLVTKIYLEKHPE